MGAGLGFAEILSVQNNVRAELLAIAHLNERREFRHDDGRGNPEQFSLVGEGLRVIARRSRNDAPLLLIGWKLRERVARAAFLETSGALQVVELAENFHAGDFAQRNRWRTRRIINRAFNAIARLLDVLKRDHAV